MKFQKEFFVGAMDVDWKKRLTNRALLEMFSNITMLHGAEAGHTAIAGTSPVSWMVMNYKVQVVKRAAMFSTLTVSTWVSGYSKVRATREYEVFGEEGEIIAKASAIWVAIDGTSGTPLRMTDELMAPLGPGPETRALQDGSFINPRTFTLEPECTKDVEIHRMMDDYNGHVHNSTYLEIAEEALPEELFRGTFDEVEIAYKNEISYGDGNGKVRLAFAQDEGQCRIAIEDPKGGKLHAAVILSNFRS